MLNGKHLINLHSAGCTGTCDQGREPCNCALGMPRTTHAPNVVNLRRRAGDVPSTFEPTQFGDEEHSKGLIGNDEGLRIIRGFLLLIAVGGFVGAVIGWARPT